MDQQTDIKCKGTELTEENREFFINQVCRATKVSPQQARSLLVKSDWNVPRAIETFKVSIYASGGAIIASQVVDSGRLLSEDRTISHGAIEKSPAELTQKKQSLTSNRPLNKLESGSFGDLSNRNAPPNIESKSIPSSISGIGVLPGTLKSALRRTSNKSDKFEIKNGKAILYFSKFRNCINVGSRPFRFHTRSVLSVYISHITHFKSVGLQSVEIFIDRKSRIQSGWIEGGASGLFHTTFEFDNFHPSRSVVKIVVWERHTIRENKVLGELTINLTELIDAELPPNFPLKIKYFKVSNELLDNKDRLGPRISCDVLTSYPINKSVTADFSEPEKKDVGIQVGKNSHRIVDHETPALLQGTEIKNYSSVESFCSGGEDFSISPPWSSNTEELAVHSFHNPEPHYDQLSSDSDEIGEDTFEDKKNQCIPVRDEEVHCIQGNVHAIRTRKKSKSTKSNLLKTPIYTTSLKDSCTSDNVSFEIVESLNSQRYNTNQGESIPSNVDSRSIANLEEQSNISSKRKNTHGEDNKQKAIGINTRSPLLHEDNIGNCDVDDLWSFNKSPNQDNDGASTVTSIRREPVSGSFRGLDKDPIPIEEDVSIVTATHDPQQGEVDWAWPILESDSGPGRISATMDRTISDSPELASRTANAWKEDPWRNQHEIGSATIPTGTKLSSTTLMPPQLMVTQIKESKNIVESPRKRGAAEIKHTIENQYALEAENSPFIL